MEGKLKGKKKPRRKRTEKKKEKEISHTSEANLHLVISEVCGGNIARLTAPALITSTITLKLRLILSLWGCRGSLMQAFN